MITHSPTARRHGRASSVLIVEDEALIALGLADCLTTMGYEVRGTTATGESAVEMAAAVVPDIVLMDLRLAGRMTGVEAAARIRESGLDVPVVFLTAYADAASLSGAVDVGTYGYLVKPFEDSELHATLQVALTRHQFERALVESNRKLEAALASVRTLKGLIPVCSWCGKIRNDRDYWQSLEAYVAENTAARVSHGMCPACSESRARDRGPRP